MLFSWELLHLWHQPSAFNQRFQCIDTRNSFPEVNLPRALKISSLKFESFARKVNLRKNHKPLFLGSLLPPPPPPLPRYSPPQEER